MASKNMGDVNIPRMGRPAGGGPQSRFAPTAKPKNARGTFRRLWSFYVKELPMLLLILLLILTMTAMTLAVPYLLGRAVDAYDIRAGVLDLTRFLSTVALIGAAYLVSWGVDFGQGYLMAGVSQKLVRIIRDTLFQKLLALPLRFYDASTHGDLMSRLSNDVDNISATIAQSTTQLMSSAITIVGSLSIMLALSPPLTLAALITVPLVLLLSRAITGRTRSFFRTQQRVLGELGGMVEENVTGLKMVKAFNREETEIERFADVNQRLREVSIKAQIWSGSMMPLMNVINNLGFASVTCVGALLALRGAVTVGVISSFLSYSRQFARPLNDIAGMLNVIQSALAGAERVFEVLDQAEEPEDAPDAVEMQRARGDIVFSHVDFSYGPEKKILQDVSFHAAPGEVIALVGPTGAGKTTIVNLLTRFYDVNAGEILIDGVDVRGYTRESLRRNFSVVLQEMCLFTGTIRENIRYGRPDATDEQVHAAAVTAGADGFISCLPDGYDTLVSGETDSLSEGQRQLLAIARAVLSDAPILILDEATSSVDTRTEIHIQRAMLKLMEGKTCFLIAHRLSTIKDADRILVVEGGRIVENGNHRELMEQKGLYYQMCVSQTSA